jgi:DNA primase catalytic core
MISRKTIDEINDLPIDQILSKYIELKPGGANMKACSPFTEEKTPSFMVSVSKGLWKCFSTGKGGNSAISFVMELNSMTYPEAIKEICEKCNIIIEFDKSEESEKYIKAAEASEEYYKINAEAHEYFMANLKKVDEATLRLTYEEAAQFELGFADSDFKSLTKHLQDKGYAVDTIIRCGLATRSEKGVFDFFNNRVMFPIFNQRGKITGFSGRRIDGQKDYKYLNTGETLVFKKSTEFLGLNMCLKNIRKEKKASLVEGNYDVCALFLRGVENVLAPCGTALTVQHVETLAKMGVTEVDLYFDGDKAGQNASEKAIVLLLANGISATLTTMPEKQDPYDVFYVEKKSHAEYIDIYQSDAMHWIAARWYANAKSTAQKADAQTKLETLFASIKNTKLRKIYMKELGKAYGFNITDVEKSVAAIHRESYQDDEETPTKYYKLPSVLTDAERKEFENRGFYEDRRANTLGYHFAGANFSIERGSNFLVKPLFHIVSFYNNRRLITIENKNGKFVIEVPSKGFVSTAVFEEACMNMGNFIWFGSSKQFKIVANKFMDEMPVAQEISTLGWQSEGFWAFADGIIINNQFRKIDSFGMVALDSINNNYFLPAFSSIYKDLKVEDDPYEAERKLRYRPGKQTFESWARLYFDVHGHKNSMFAIAFLVASIFRDLIQKKSSFFPILFNFGDIQTGKSQAARSLAAVFLAEVKPVMLNSVTLSAFGIKLGEFRNVMNWFDEYTNDIDERIFQGLKALWDGAGREKGKIGEGNKIKTKADNVYSAAVVSGQYIPSRDSNSLFTRSVILTYDVKSEDRTAEEVQKFEELSLVQQQGLSNIIVEILKCRQAIEDEYNETSSDIMTEMKQLYLQNEETFNGRVLGNYAVLLAVVKILEKRLKFPFSYDTMQHTAYEFVRAQSDAIQDSDVLTNYWKMVEFLYLEFKIVYNEDFKIDYGVAIESFYGSGKTIYKKEFTPPKDLLYIQFRKIHPLYLEMHKRQQGHSGVNENSIKSYMKSSKAFVGIVDVCQFKERRTSAWVFDYGMLREGGICLDPVTSRDYTKPQPATVDHTAPTIKAEEEELPF